MATKAPVDELDAFYAALGDVSKAGLAYGDRASIFSIPSASESTTAPLVIQDLPSLPTAPKLDDVQLAGIAAARAAEQLAKSEDRKRKAAPPSIGIGGGGKKVRNTPKSNFYWRPFLNRFDASIADSFSYVNSRSRIIYKNGLQSRWSYILMVQESPLYLRPLLQLHLLALQDLQALYRP